MYVGCPTFLSEKKTNPISDAIIAVQSVHTCGCCGCCMVKPPALAAALPPNAPPMKPLPSGAALPIAPLPQQEEGPLGFVEPTPLPETIRATPSRLPRDDGPGASCPPGSWRQTDERSAKGKGAGKHTADSSIGRGVCLALRNFS